MSRTWKDTIIVLMQMIPDTLTVNSGVELMSRTMIRRSGMRRWRNGNQT